MPAARARISAISEALERCVVMKYERAVSSACCDCKQERAGDQSVELIASKRLLRQRWRVVYQHSHSPAVQALCMFETLIDLAAGSARSPHLTVSRLGLVGVRKACRA